MIAQHVGILRGSLTRKIHKVQCTCMDYHRLGGPHWLEVVRSDSLLPGRTGGHATHMEGVPHVCGTAGMLHAFARARQVKFLILSG